MYVYANRHPLTTIAWIVAAFLPLPTVISEAESVEAGYKSAMEMPESKNTSAHLMMSYERTRWWRGLNRVMAAVGVVITSAYVVLIIIGAKQPWT